MTILNELSEAYHSLSTKTKVILVTGTIAALLITGKEVYKQGFNAGLYSMVSSGVTIKKDYNTDKKVNGILKDSEISEIVGFRDLL